MKLDPARCPECGSPAFALTEIVYIDAFLAHDAATDEYAYTGASAVIWETQAPARPSAGSVEAQCPERHFWTATATPDVEGVTAGVELVASEPAGELDPVPTETEST